MRLCITSFWKRKSECLLMSCSMEVKVSVTQSCLTLCNAMNCSPTGSSVHGIFQARILDWVAISSSRGSFWPRDQTWVSCIAGKFFTIWTTREDHVAWKQGWKTSRDIEGNLAQRKMILHPYSAKHSSSWK